jgi:integrase
LSTSLAIHHRNLTPFDTNWKKGSGATPVTTQGLLKWTQFSIPTALPKVSLIQLPLQRGGPKNEAGMGGVLAFLRRVLLYAVKISRPSAGQQPLKWTLLTTPFVAHGVEFLRENRRERIINFDEERRYLAAARQPLRDVAILMLEMGLRPGEACSIRRQNVHLFGSAHVHIPEGKTKNARRDAPVTDRAREVLKARLAAAKGEYIFPSRVGTGHDWNSPMAELDPAHRSALRESKITPSFRIYDLRHTYGTRAIESGTDPLTLMRLMGHEELSTTDRYVHLSKRHLNGAQQKIETYRAVREIAEVEEMKTARNESTAVQ